MSNIYIFILEDFKTVQFIRNKIIIFVPLTFA